MPNRRLSFPWREALSDQGEAVDRNSTMIWRPVRPATDPVGGLDLMARLPRSQRAFRTWRGRTRLCHGGAVAEALRALRVTRVAVAHPDGPQVASRLCEFLTASGSRSWRCAVTSDRPDAEAVCVSCTALPTYEVIAPWNAN
jgi:hypothetical protein